MFAARLARLLDLNDMPPKELAHRCGISQRAVYALLAGERQEPSMGTLIGMAQALDVSLDWLATGQTRQPDELTPEEQDVIRRLRQASPTERDMVLRSIRGMLSRDEDEE